MTSISRQNVLFLAVGLAALTTFVAYRLLFLQAKGPISGTANVVPSGPPLVAVANRDIQPLELLDRGMFHMVKPSGEAPKEPITALEQIDGRIATNFIAKDEPAKTTDLAYPDPTFGMAFQVPPGTRALTVPVNSVSGIAGFLKPGNRVDVLATFDLPGGGAVTRTVVQDVIILAYGQTIQPEPKQAEDEEKETEKPEPQLADTATLLVSPAQSEPLALAATKARLSLALRGIKESARFVRMAGATSSQVTDTAEERQRRLQALTALRPASPPATPPALTPPAPSAPAPPVATEPPGRSILVIRGTRQEIVQVPR
jgi:pilus assembly protein CpaB